MKYSEITLNGKGEQTGIIGVVFSHLLG